MKVNNAVKRITRIAILSCILLVQEEALSFIPNIQLTSCLIAIYFVSFGLLDTLLIVTVHTLIDCMIGGGGLSIVFTPTMLFAWFSLVLILFIFKRKLNRITASVIVLVHGFIYGLVFALTSVFYYQTKFLPYFLADLPAEITMAICGFVTTFFLYKPLTTRLIELNNR